MKTPLMEFHSTHKDILDKQTLNDNKDCGIRKKGFVLIQVTLFV